MAKQGRRGSSARIVRVIGRPDVASAVIEALMLDRGLARRFHPEVEREASQARDRGLEGSGTGPARHDLRRLATFTIDPAAARDFDDAISAERIDGGGVRVWVHIADVSAYVGEGSLLDREARLRATSVYVPGAVEPMLPQALSTTPARCCPARIGSPSPWSSSCMGEVGRTAFYRSLIRSDERLDYERVDRIFAGRERAGEPWKAPLMAARDAAAALQRAREQHGALVIDSEEPEFVFDERGNVTEVPRACADRVTPTGRASDDRRQRGLSPVCSSSGACPACIASTSARSPSAWNGWPISSPRWGCPRLRCPTTCPASRPPSSWAPCRAGSMSTCGAAAAGASR